MVSEASKDAPVLDGTAMQAAVAAAMTPVLDFAAGPSGLVSGGRLVFLFPSFDFAGCRDGSSDERESLLAALPQHAHLTYICHCTQEFKGMARHAVVLERTPL
jgi:hypothetical protein